MAVASFESLCAGFCEFAKVPLPALTPDSRGNLAFHVTLREVTVNLLFCQASSADHAFVVIELGPLPGDASDGLERLLALLDANFLPLRVHPAVFTRNPANGDAAMQYVYPLMEASSSGLLRVIEEGVEIALRWRVDPCALRAGVPHRMDEVTSPGVLSALV